MKKTPHVTLWAWALTTALAVGIASGGVAEEAPRIQGQLARKLSFGNLRKLTLKGGNGQYALNSVELPRISRDEVDLTTSDQSIRVRATFLKTVLISKSRPINTENDRLLRQWSEQIPLVAHILSEQDSLGAMKPVVYDLLQPKAARHFELQEELVLLWSADPADESRIGDTELRPAMPFRGRLTDVQYRGIREPGKRLIGKIILQILYVRTEGRPMTLGGFVIVSKPTGEFEFYLVPRSLLEEIVISDKTDARLRVPLGLETALGGRGIVFWENVRG